MKTTNLFTRLSGAIAVVSSAAFIGVPALAQFYFPSASYFSPWASPYQSEDNPNVAELLEMNDDFETVTSLLARADLTEALKQEQVTIFAPTDKAFESLPRATRQQLSEPENLTKILKYHVVEGTITDADIKSQEVATLLGTPVRMVFLPSGENFTTKLNNANASEPLPASNGVVIPIDKVLLPPEF
ncbi:fasciclin domain-containing protein [Pleurocapsales cyanobacterium LEGE 06147]|nr:fasciclin domain-containing protein [Pleurocapsales cyanobacterium LEGE 06147]